MATLKQLQLRFTQSQNKISKLSAELFAVKTNKTQLTLALKEAKINEKSLKVALKTTAKKAPVKRARKKKA